MISGLPSWLLYLFGLSPALTDARPAWLSTAVCRVAIFGALYLCFVISWDVSIGGDGAFRAWYASKAEGVYHPFGLLKLFGGKVPSEEFWWIVRWIAQVSTICAIVGFLTRPMMIASVVSVNLLALLQISDNYFWSHNWNVLFLVAYPFALSNAGSAYSVDRLLGHVWPAYPFGRRTEPVLWGVLAGQASIAFFLFAAFWAKLFQTFEKAGWLGPWYYVFSDNMRNILGVFWLGTPENLPPPWIEWAWSTPVVWQLLILGHLVMQAAPLLALVSLHRPWARLLEGVIFFGGIVALGVIARGWNWAWFPLVVLFVDWDYFAGSRNPGGGPVAPWRLHFGAMPVVAAFFVVYTVGWVTQTANRWGWYPFSNMSFYAGLYIPPPYGQHGPYADYMIGETTLRPPPGADPHAFLPPGWLDTTDKGWRDYGDTPSPAFRVRDGEITFPFYGNNIHGLGRERDLDRLLGGLKHAAQRLGLSGYSKGRYISWLKTAGFPAYPEPMHKKTLHAGVRGIWDSDTDQFAGMTAELDRDMGRIVIKDIRGETGKTAERNVFVRFDAHLSSDVLPLIQVPGEWVDDRVFQIAAGFLDSHRGQLLNSIIRTQTSFGVVDFDGPVQWL